MFIGLEGKSLFPVVSLVGVRALRGPLACEASHLHPNISLIDHPSIKVGEQMSFLPMVAFLCLTFLLTMKLDNMSFKI
jgi:hypothetical protein